MSDNFKPAIGKRIKDISYDSFYGLTVTLEDGSAIRALEGDSGTMFNSEPYFKALFVPAPKGT